MANDCREHHENLQSNTAMSESYSIAQILSRSVPKMRAAIYTYAMAAASELTVMAAQTSHTDTSCLSVVDIGYVSPELESHCNGRTLISYSRNYIEPPGTRTRPTSSSSKTSAMHESPQAISDFELQKPHRPIATQRRSGQKHAFALRDNLCG